MKSLANQLALLFLFCGGIFISCNEQASKEEKSAVTEESHLEWIAVGKGKDQTNFVKSASNERFLVWGVNYDHDSVG
jgi:hypothetical protein